MTTIQKNIPDNHSRIVNKIKIEKNSKIPNKSIIKMH